jgi:hypothetical protein
VLEERERKEFDVTYDFLLDFLFEDGILYAGYDSFGVLVYFFQICVALGRLKSLTNRST